MKKPLYFNERLSVLGIEKNKNIKFKKSKS
jgi:hypothetical protein